LIEKYSLQSTPALFIDDEPFSTGRTELSKVLAFITEKEAEKKIRMRIYNLMALRLDALALELICAHDLGPSALAALVNSPDLSTRLAAITLCEEIPDTCNSRVHDVAQRLGEYLPDAGITITGDIIMALGMLKDPQSIDLLRPYCDHENEDISEAAQEAIEDIESE